MRISRLLAAMCVVILFGGCGGDESDSQPTTSSSTASSIATPAVLPVDEALRAALGEVVQWTPIDATEAGRRFSGTRVSSDESIFGAYWAGEGSFDGQLVAAAALNVSDAEQPSTGQRLEAQFAQDSPSRQVGDTKVFSQPDEQYLYWYASPNVIFVQADDGAVAVALVEAMLAP